jgi:hypothetical protein
MNDYFEGDMTGHDHLANKHARFHPAVNAHDNNGSYAPPCLEIGGVQVYAYVRDGILVISLHYDEADTSESTPFALYGPDCIPTVIYDGAGEVAWEALPDDAVTGDDARLIRKHNADNPDAWPAWVLPDWVDGE